MSPFPSVLLNYTDGNQPTVVINNTTYNNWADVVKNVEGVDQPENALIVARMLTHFSYRSRYKVIGDPSAYETTYRKRVTAELVAAATAAAEPTKNKGTRTPVLGTPDFSEISAPQIRDGQLIFFVYDAALLAPYKIEAVPTEPDITKQKQTLLPLKPSTAMSNV